MTVLLTGAGGFLGRNILEALAVRGISCIAVNDSLMPAACAELPGVTVETADVRDRAAMASILTRHDVTRVIHAAAVTLAPGSRLTGVETAFDVNMVSTAILLQEAQKAGVSRFVYPSSTAVYGAALWDDAPVTETTPPRPTSVYGYTKLASERLVKEQATSFGLPCVIARITALFGPHERMTGTRDMLSVPFQIAQHAMAGRDLVLPAALSRDWTSARDAAAALAGLALAPDMRDDLYNIGIGAVWSPALLANHLAEVRPGWRWHAGSVPTAARSLTFHDDPQKPRQPLVADKFKHDFDFTFRSPDQACRDYTDWLMANHESLAPRTDRVTP